MTSEKTFNSPEVKYYFERFGFCESLIKEPPVPGLGIVIVIPAYKEHTLIPTLQALLRATKPACAVEVIFVVNSGENESTDTLAVNENALAELRSYPSNRSVCDLRVYALDCPNLPARKKGVGLARKIGMDEALRRFDYVNRPEGIILCLDADCTCDFDYLVEIEKWFSAPERVACSIYFEHPLENPDNQKVTEAIILYELHLRYYVQSLRFASFPYAFHTIGSSMAVRSDVYRKQGGMNKRQAGEDFYFLHKVIPLGGFGDLTGTRVVASPRPSDRVPFGTGRAVGEFLEGREILTYNHQSFIDLKSFFEQVPRFHTLKNLPSIPESMDAFLAKMDFTNALAEMLKNSASLITFQKRFFHWFDGFQVVKFLPFARDNFYPSQPVYTDASTLFPLISGCDVPQTDSPLDLLLQYRRWERQNPQFYSP